MKQSSTEGTCGKNRRFGHSILALLCALLGTTLMVATPALAGNRVRVKSKTAWLHLEASKRADVKGIVIKGRFLYIHETADKWLLVGLKPKLDESADQVEGWVDPEDGRDHVEIIGWIQKSKVTDVGDDETSPVAEELPPLERTPRIAKQTAPIYPLGARRNRIEGRVTLKADVSEKGKVNEVFVLDGIGHGCNRAAIEALRKWGFQPGIREGKASVATVVLTITFALQ